MAKKTFILEKNNVSAFYVYGSADAYSSIIATASNIIQETARTILLDVEVGGELSFKIKTSTSGLSLPYTISNKGIQFDYDDLDRVYVSLPVSYNSNFYIETRFKLIAKPNAAALMGEHSSSGLNCYFGSSGGTFYSIIASTGGAITGVNFNIDTWYKVKMEFDGTAHTLKTYLDDVLVKNLGVASFTQTEIKFPIGKFSNPTLNADGSWVIDWIDLNGKFFNMDSILFDCVTDNNNNPYVIESLKSDFSTMLVTI